MSKRPAPDDKPASLPFAKKSRLEIDEGLAEVRAKSASLLEGLKLQKTTFQWPQPSAREEIITNIAKAETMMSSLTKLEQKSKNASETVEKLIDAIINNELKQVLSLARRDMECDEQGPEGRVMEGLLVYDAQIRAEVTKIVKEKMQGLAASAIIAKAKAETEGAFKDVASKKLLSILKAAMGSRV
ncbi:hypothetical protein D6D26_07337 [Aureobasidium pullulans]|nr:hypothetical protein D6D26_07337 [Aureobasidium pullulans]